MGKTGCLNRLRVVMADKMLKWVCRKSPYRDGDPTNSNPPWLN